MSQSPQAHLYIAVPVMAEVKDQHISRLLQIPWNFCQLIETQILKKWRRFRITKQIKTK